MKPSAHSCKPEHDGYKLPEEEHLDVALLRGMSFFTTSRTCSDCGAHLTDGRSDKRFCDDACRLRHHRKLLVPHPVLHEVDRTLQRNRSLLKRARTESLDMRPAEEAFRWLRKQGFDFNFHTHISTLPDGRLAVMCYEEGYVVEEAGVRPLHPSPAPLPGR
jgi:hypothetical protein